MQVTVIDKYHKTYSLEREEKNTHKLVNARKNTNVHEKVDFRGRRKAVK
jgi:hypothetical protein